MWMMGCSDGGEFSIPESFNGRKLRPLMPRTPMAPSTHGSNTSPPRLSRLHGNDIFSLNHHLANMADQSKRDFHTQQVVVSSRWNPTPEQLRTLEELYRRGTRTPSTEQIQHITAQLRRYGKIEGKNVFYWFQNHKARERQKRRRQLESAITSSDNEQQQQQQLDIEMFERKESGGNGEQIKNWALSTNCSTLPEESISTQRGAEKGGNMAESCRGEIGELGGWYQLDEMEFQNRKNFIERNATWQMMQLSCPSPTTHLINTTSAPFCNFSTTSSSSSTLKKSESAKTKSTPAIRTMDPMLIKTNIFIAPYYTQNGHLFNEEEEEEEEDNDNGCGESQTLQLFPLRSSNSINEGNQSINDKETESSFAAMNANSAPSTQFFEFLPMKN